MATIGKKLSGELEDELDAARMEMTLNIGIDSTRRTQR
jgi:hypothetical protein